MANFYNFERSERGIDFLRRELRLREICQEICDQQLIYQTAEARGITVTPEEIQVEVNRIRYENRLESSSDLITWLDQQFATLSDVETDIRVQ